MLYLVLNDESKLHIYIYNKGLDHLKIAILEDSKSKNSNASKGSSPRPAGGLTVSRRLPAVVQQHYVIADQSGIFGTRKFYLYFEHCKVKQNSLHQLNPKYKACSVFYKMVSAFSPP